MATKYTVFLSPAERTWLEEMTRKGCNVAPKILQARALLLCDASENGPAWPVHINRMNHICHKTMKLPPENSSVGNEKRS